MRKENIVGVPSSFVFRRCPGFLLQFFIIIFAEVGHHGLTLFVFPRSHPRRQREWSERFEDISTQTMTNYFQPFSRVIGSS